MNDHRHRHGLTDDARCALCLQHDEEIDHLLLSCVYSHEVWFMMLGRYGWHQLSPKADEAMTTWWLRACDQVVKACRPALDSLVLLVTRGIWLHRNDQVFNSVSLSLMCLA
jgi:hypothetical protein